jgi:hypothetical protein
MSAGGPPFDPSAPAHRAWWADLNVTLDDAHALVVDMLKPARRRELGHLKHDEMFTEAWSKLMVLLGRDGPPPPEGEGDPPMH